MSAAETATAVEVVRHFVFSRDQKRFRSTEEMAEHLRWMWIDRMPKEITERWAWSQDDVNGLLMKYPAEVILEGMTLFSKYHKQVTKKGNLQGEEEEWFLLKKFIGDASKAASTNPSKRRERQQGRQYERLGRDSESRS